MPLVHGKYRELVLYGLFDERILLTWLYLVNYNLHEWFYHEENLTTFKAKKCEEKKIKFYWRMRVLNDILAYCIIIYLQLHDLHQINIVSYRGEFEMTKKWD